MKIRLDNPAFFSKAIEIISELVTEVRINVNEFGMSISAIDPANVAMVGFKLPRSAFAEFEITEVGGKESLGVNLDNLKQVLKRAGAKSSLILQRRDNFLDINIFDKIVRKFSLGLIEIEGEEVDFNEKDSRMEFSGSVELASSELIDSIDDCAVVADACSFSIGDGKFIIEAKSLNSARTEFSSDEAGISGENCKSKYSLEYLQKFMKAAKLCDKTILKWLVANSPYLSSEADVIPTPELAGAGAGGTDRMMAYDYDSDKVVMHIPKPLIFTEPQRKGRGFEVPGTYKCGGVEFRYPGSARYADGI